MLKFRIELTEEEARALHYLIVAGSQAGNGSETLGSVHSKVLDGLFATRDKARLRELRKRCG
jgi:hypothetical protein